MTRINVPEYKTFENIKKINENGEEFWYARELQVVLEYKQWRRFSEVIDKARLACRNSGYGVKEHFADVGKTIKMPKTATKLVIDYKLTRYACCLIVQNGDPEKDVVALGKHILLFKLATNLFRITQTESKLKRENIKSVNKANNTHYTVGKEVRAVIKKIGGTMPKELPTPEKSIEEIERKEIKN